MTPTYILLYVDDPLASGAFYQDLLGRAPVDSAPTFVLFVFETGLKLGLWSKHSVAPAAAMTGGGGEVGFAVAAEALEPTYADWSARGITMAQPLTDMDFGRTFVALDPDGHRLRVFTPSP